MPKLTFGCLRTLPFNHNTALNTLGCLINLHYKISFLHLPLFYVKLSFYDLIPGLLKSIIVDLEATFSVLRGDY